MTEARRRAALALLASVQFIVILDSTITTVALDDVRADLGGDERTLQYVVTLYAVTFGGLLLLAGRIGDLVGRRQTFAAGAATFTAASAVCAIAPTMPWLLAGRAAQGVGAAFVSAAAFALVLDLYGEGPGRNRALGLWSAMGASGAAAGLIAGGVLTDLAGWGAVFAVNVPPGVLAVALAGRLLPAGRRSRARGTARPDVLGAVTVTLGTAALVLALARGPADGWTGGGTLALFTAAAVLIGGFVLVERRARDPLIPLSALTTGPVPLAAVTLGCLLAVVSSQCFFLVLYLQRVLDLGATATGAAIAPSAAMAFAGSTIAARLAGRIRPGGLTVGGLLFVAAAQLLLSRLPVDGWYPGDLLPGLLLFGFGLGVAFVGATIDGAAGLATADQGLASGLLNTGQQLGTAVGVAALVGVTAASASRPDALAAAYGDGLRLGALVAMGGAAVVVVTGLTTTLRRPRGASREAVDAR
ncbi:MFS transporter [Cryptosporangium minutisporangium]|uniref:DHA2 family efflux MFS transporter permease subunit n=1 Tax=Cryptosporangium minutisporangium TaxID=113569 RepID=A0ABP6SST9_9ACTN